LKRKIRRTLMGGRDGPNRGVPGRKTEKFKKGLEKQRVSYWVDWTEKMENGKNRGGTGALTLERNDERGKRERNRGAWIPGKN